MGIIRVWPIVVNGKIKHYANMLIMQTVMSLSFFFICSCHSYDLSSDFIGFMWLTNKSFVDTSTKM